MKLQTKLFEITNQQGEPIDIDGLDVIIFVNGKEIVSHLHDVIEDAEFDEGEIYGNTLLSYYTPTAEGKLSVEGSEVQLVIAGTNEPILVHGISRPAMNDDTDIPFEQIKIFADIFSISKPEEVFYNLTDEEKQRFISERKSEPKPDDAGQEEAEAAETAAQAEAELKKSIDPIMIQYKNNYLKTKKYYAGLGFKEYQHHPYHLFYAKHDEVEPLILIRRGDTWWEECEDTSLMDETDNKVEIEFKDGELTKNLILNIETDEMTITDYNSKE